MNEIKINIGEIGCLLEFVAVLSIIYLIKLILTPF